MRPSEPDQPGSPIDLAVSREEERLRTENEELRRQLEALRRPAPGSSDAAAPAHRWRPSAITIWAIFLISLILVAVAFFAGYIPMRKRQATIRAESQEQERTLPRVEVIEVVRSSLQNGLALLFCGWGHMATARSCATETAFGALRSRMSRGL